MSLAHGVYTREVESLQMRKMITPGYRVESTNRFLSLPSRPVSLPTYKRYPMIKKVFYNSLKLSNLGKPLK